MNTPVAHALLRRLEQGGTLSCAEVPAAGVGFLAAWLARVVPARPLLLVTDGLKSQESLEQDLHTWLQFDPFPPRVSGDAGIANPAPPRSARFYPAWETLPHEDRLPHADVISERLETLVALADWNARPAGPAPIVVTSVQALMQRTFSPSELRARTRRLRRGDRQELMELADWLEAQAYEPEAQVTQKGEMALRGGILDVFPPSSPWPIRLEFFGDELESLRYFDPATQVSRGPVESCVLTPAGELGILKHALSDGPRDPQGRPGSTDSPGLFSDHLPPHSLVLLVEPPDLADQAQRYAAQIPVGHPLFAAWDEVQPLLSARERTRLLLREGPPAMIAPSADEPGPMEPGEVIAFGAASLETFRPVADTPGSAPVLEAQRRSFFDQVHRWTRQGYAVHVFCNNEGERQRFHEIWAEYGLPAPGVDADPADASAFADPTTHVGTLSRGFLSEPARMVVITDAEVFGRYRTQRPRRLKSPHAPSMRSALEIDFTDLEDGDYVVHVQHGIGRYLGLQQLPVSVAGTSPGPASGPDNRTTGEECLVIEYASSDAGQPPPKLYVPVAQAHLVSKYVGTGKARPPLNTLGGNRWARAKAQAERAIRDFAGELLAIQAARDAEPGHPFPPDAPWQREFEASFLYEETPDQAKAIREAKADMERPRPMDRLVCGDVGFGKTEVALRAAFKAVMGGKQVAVLVPTTVLAQQHYNTFRERMADYPIRIELLSRYRTRRQQQQVLQDLAAGSVDVVVGTHRLVQPDVTFKDLGLVVIDEEQRFGVLHKEKFKVIRRLVDVLTLSATPIPRTLHLALTGARDMSVIETPPQDRLPVETIVTPYDERTIRDAVRRELNRGGQVFFLHNRVSTIDAIALRLRQLVPEARIVIGHGQMASDDLEQIMTAFVNGEADVLLSTTIIESGLDIPNANTIIIDRADRFGLSDLYQLRGRVGRYKHQAYAYFLLPRHARLLSDARKRISSIKQYSALGSGFKIAMRDLEIRGAGNLLGAEQSGHITAVGFELYCQLLKQSIAARKGETLPPRVEVALRFDCIALSPGEASDPSVPATPGDAVREPAFLPLAYISDARQRIEVYRRLAEAADQQSVDGLEAELRDRFGPVPAAAALLLQITRVKILAAARGIHAIETRGDRLMLSRQGDFITLGGKFPRLSHPDARGKVGEIRRLLLALDSGPAPGHPRSTHPHPAGKAPAPNTLRPKP